MRLTEIFLIYCITEYSAKVMEKEFLRYAIDKHGYKPTVSEKVFLNAAPGTHECLIAYKQLPLRIHPSKNCRYCSLAVETIDDACVTSPYGTSIWSLSHKSCLEKGEEEEAYLAQCELAQCNNCKHFEFKEWGYSAPDRFLFGICKLGNKQVPIMETTSDSAPINTGFFPTCFEGNPRFKHRKNNN